MRPPRTYEVESQLVADVLIEFGRLPWLWLWRSNTGAVKIKDSFVRFGLPGQPDIQGIIKSEPLRGRFFGIELKIKGRKQRPDQLRWQALCESCGGIYVLAYQVDDVWKAFAAAGILEACGE